MALIDNEKLYENIEKKLELIKAVKEQPVIMKPFIKDFAYRFCWSSNALEGNTLSLDETICLIDYDEVRSGQYQYCKQYEDLPDCKEEICRKVYGASAGNGQDASKVHEIPEAVLLCRIEGRNVLYHASQAILQICRKDRK